jgi:hypothetical protein
MSTVIALTTTAVGSVLASSCRHAFSRTIGGGDAGLELPSRLRNNLRVVRPQPAPQEVVRKLHRAERPSSGLGRRPTERYCDR